MTSSFNPQSEIPNPQFFRLFVYGTLKRGFWNHDRFCRGVVTVEDAPVHGRLFETSSGIPVLQVPEEDILAVGTTNPLADVATQAHVTARLFNPQYEGAPWGPVYGELLTFENPETRLPAIDRLEGFHPGGPCLYRRALVAVQANGGVLHAWLYVGENPISGGLTPLGGSCWPR